MKAFLAPRGVTAVHWFLAGARDQSHWLGTQSRGSGVPSDLEGGSITNLSTCDNESGPSQAGPGNKHPFEAGLGACIVILSEAQKVPLGPWNHRSPRGAFTLLGPDFIRVR